MLSKYKAAQVRPIPSGTDVDVTGSTLRAVECTCDPADEYVLDAVLLRSSDDAIDPKGRRLLVAIASSPGESIGP
jgi:hypothetical protein